MAAFLPQDERIVLIEDTAEISISLPNLVRLEARRVQRGHSGSITTIHADTATLALSRLRTCVAMAGVDIPDKAVARNIAEVVQLVFTSNERAGNGKVTQVLRIDEYDPGNDRYRFTDLLAAESVDARSVRASRTGAYSAQPPRSL